MADAEQIFFNKIIMGDDTWYFAYDPETKRKSSEYIPSAEETEIPKAPHQ